MNGDKPYTLRPTHLRIDDITVSRASDPAQQRFYLNLHRFLELTVPGQVLVLSVETEDGRLLERRRIPLQHWDSANAVDRHYGPPGSEKEGSGA